MSNSSQSISKKQILEILEAIKNAKAECHVINLSDLINDDSDCNCEKCKPDETVGETVADVSLYELQVKLALAGREINKNSNIVDTMLNMVKRIDGISQEIKDHAKELSETNLDKMSLDEKTKSVQFLMTSFSKLLAETMMSAPVINNDDETVSPLLVEAANDIFNSLEKSKDESFDRFGDFIEKLYSKLKS